MSTLRTRIVASITAILNKTVGTTVGPFAPAALSVGSVPSIDPAVYDFATGSGAGQASKSWAVEQTVNAIGAISWDLTNLIDGFGDALSFTHVKACMVHVISGAGTLNMTDTFNPLSTADSIAAKAMVPGDVFLVVRPAGILIGAGNKSLSLSNPSASGTVTVRVQIVGD